MRVLQEEEEEGEKKKKGKRKENEKVEEEKEKKKKEEEESGMKSPHFLVSENTADIYLRCSHLDQEKKRSSARQDRMDVHGASIRNVIGRPEHSWKNCHHMVSGHGWTAINLLD